MTDSPVRTEGQRPSPSAVDEIVLRVVGAWAPDPDMTVSMDHHLLNDLHFASLRMVELAFIFEELLEMDPATMGEAPFVETVGELRDFLREKVEAGAATLPEPDSVERLLASMQ